jgi:hypothetical protein
MINLWFGDCKYPPGVVRGPVKVISNLIKSLDDCKIHYVINEEIFENNLFLHWDSSWFEKYSNLRNKENLLIGPHVWPFGPDLDVLNQYKSLLFPSKWCEDSCNKFFPNLKTAVWPIAIYKPNIKIKSNPSVECLVYYKNRPKEDLLNVLNFLEQNNITYTGLEYGNYTQEEFKESLEEVKYCIIVDNTESQGIAIQEMMICNKPLFVWDKVTWDDLGSDYIVPATSIPYWSNECGERVTSFEDFKLKFDSFKNNLSNYCPENFINRELSPQKSIEILFSNYV